MFTLKDVGHTTLAGLAIDAHDRLVGPANVVRVDGQVGDFPYEVVNGGSGGAARQFRLHRVEPLLDRILVRP